VTSANGRISSSMLIMAGKRQREPEVPVLQDSYGLKRKRSFTEDNEKLARVYEKLADDDSEIRINAAKDLIALLSTKYSQDAETVEKILSRLIRGLCSSRKFARYGYFVALTEALRQRYGSSQKNSIATYPSRQELLSMIASLTKIGGKSAGQVRPSILRCLSLY
jgi:DNA polymerase phi